MYGNTLSTSEPQNSLEVIVGAEAPATGGIATSGGSAIMGMLGHILVIIIRV
jgi:hypothetical protein